MNQTTPGMPSYGYLFLPQPALFHLSLSLNIKLSVLQRWTQNPFIFSSFQHILVTSSFSAFHNYLSLDLCIGTAGHAKPCLLELLKKPVILGHIMGSLPQRKPLWPIFYCCAQEIPGETSFKEVPFKYLSLITHLTKAKTESQVIYFHFLYSDIMIKWEIAL